MACTAVEPLAPTVPVSTACGSRIRPLALERAAAAEGDALVAACQRPGAPGPEHVRLQRRAFGGWATEEEEEEDGRLELSMTDCELSAALLGQTGAPSPTCAPRWPRDVMDGLDPWPLKGPGTIVFDGGYFLDRIAERVAPGKGLLLFPDGAAKLRLPTVVPQAALDGALGLCESLAAQLLRANGGVADRPAGVALPYGELLAASDAVRSGVVDFSRRHAAVGPRRTAHLEPQAFGGFGLEYVPRTWARGAALRALEPGGEAECAGCREGDVVDGRPFLEAPLSEVRASLADSGTPLVLEVEQAAVQAPFYIREASTRMLHELGGASAEEAAVDLVPCIQRLLDGRAGRSLCFEEHRPMVFAGDGGSASRLHADQQHRVQFCHMLHGLKLFALDTSGTVGTGDDARASGYNEVSLPVDLPLPPEQAAWLSAPEVSVAAARAGDIFCFWGGDRHCGANALSSGPSVALFHSCSKKEEPTS